MSSRILYNAGILSFACTESIMIGIMSALNLNIMGFSASSGNSDFTISNLSRTSLVRTSMSSPNSNSRVINDMFSFDSEEMCFKSLTAFNAFSKGRVRLFSISAALAPGYAVMTIIVLVSISGKRSIGSFVREKSPIMATATKHNDVIIGFFTEPSYRLI